MAMPSEALLKKIASAPVSKNGTRLGAGTYKLAVEHFEYKQGEKGDTFITEFRVLTAEKAPGAVTEPNPVGSTASYVLVLQSTPAAFGNLKSLACALDGSDSSTTSDTDLMKIIRTMCSNVDNVRGKTVGASSWTKDIKSGPNAGKPFVGFNWTFIKQTKEEMSATAKSLDA